MQMEGGRYFLAEHPERSRQWSLPKWKTLLSKKEVHKVKGDQCEFGLVCPEGHPVQKRTCFVANSLLLVRPLGRFCKGDTNSNIESLKAQSKDNLCPNGVNDGPKDFAL